jgi:hypothetical protein
MDRKFVRNAIRDEETGMVWAEDTGELLKENELSKGQFITDEEAERRRKQFNKKREKDKQEKDSMKVRIKDLEEEYGAKPENVNDKRSISPRWVWAFFQRQEELFPDLKPQDISRLIYLSTYLKYNTNILVHNDKNKNRPILKNELNDYMNLHRSVYNTWIKKMLECGYLEFDDEDKVIMNSNFFAKGKLSGLDDKPAVRIFIKMIQELYLNLKPTDHHKMGIILQMIPYMNPNFNCMCKNPRTQDITKVQAMRLGEFVKELGYSERQSRRIGKELLKTKYGKDEKRMVALIAIDDLRPENMVILVNPRLFFSEHASKYWKTVEIFDRYIPKEIEGKSSDLELL